MPLVGVFVLESRRDVCFSGTPGVALPDKMDASVTDVFELPNTEHVSLQDKVGVFLADETEVFLPEKVCL